MQTVPDWQVKVDISSWAPSAYLLHDATSDDLRQFINSLDFDFPALQTTFDARYLLASDFPNLEDIYASLVDGPTTDGLLDDVTLTVDGVTATQNKTGRTLDLSLSEGYLTGVSATNILGSASWSQDPALTEIVELDGSNVRLRTWQRPRLIGATGEAYATGNILIPSDLSDINLQFRGGGASMVVDENHVTHNVSTHVLTVQQEGYFTVDLRVGLQPVVAGTVPGDDAVYQVRLSMSALGGGTALGVATEPYGHRQAGTEFIWLHIRLENIYLDVGGTIEAVASLVDAGAALQDMEIWAVGCNVSVLE